MALDIEPLSFSAPLPSTAQHLVEEARWCNADLVLRLRDYSDVVPSWPLWKGGSETELVIDFGVIDAETVQLFFDVYHEHAAIKQLVMSPAALRFPVTEFDGFVPELSWVADFVESDVWKAISESPALLHYTSQLAIYEQYYAPKPKTKRFYWSRHDFVERVVEQEAA